MAGTIGHKLMSGKATRVKVDNRTHVDVRCQVHMLSFSAHTDAKGIMDLVKHVSPLHTVLVHGEKPKMALLKSRISSELGIPCYDPMNNVTIDVPCHHEVKVDVTKQFLKCNMNMARCMTQGKLVNLGLNMQSTKGFEELLIRDRIPAEGIVSIENAQKAKVFHSSELSDAYIEAHKVQFMCCCPIYIDTNSEIKPNELCSSKSELLSMPEPEEHLRKKQCIKLQENVTDDIEQELHIHQSCKFASDTKTLAVHCPCTLIKDGNSGEADVNANIKSSSGFSELNNCNKTSRYLQAAVLPSTSEGLDLLHSVYLRLVRNMGGLVLKEHKEHIQGKSLCIRICADEKGFYKTYGCPENSNIVCILCCSWEKEDDGLAIRVFTVLQNLKLNIEEFI